MVQNVEEQQEYVQRILERELARLKTMIPFEEILTLCWYPQPENKVSGQVVGNTLYIYSETVREAVETLQHEYLDCLLTRKIIEPLITMVNTFIKLKEREIYQEKERIVARLLKLV